MPENHAVVSKSAVFTHDRSRMTHDLSISIIFYSYGTGSYPDPPHG